MYYNNPFSGWTEAGQQPSCIWGQGMDPPPSIFGALPSPSSPSYLSFYFTSFSPDIFNSTVIGPCGQLLYHVVTNNQNPGYTVITKAEGTRVTLIEWQRSPFVEVRGVLAKQHVKNWLKLSNERMYVCLVFGSL